MPSSSGPQIAASNNSTGPAHKRQKLSTLNPTNGARVSSPHLNHNFGAKNDELTRKPFVRQTFTGPIPYLQSSTPSLKEIKKIDRIWQESEIGPNKSLLKRYWGDKRGVRESLTVQGRGNVQDFYGRTPSIAASTTTKTNLDKKVTS